MPWPHCACRTGRRVRDLARAGRARHRHRQLREDSTRRRDGDSSSYTSCVVDESSGQHPSANIQRRLIHDIAAMLDPAGLPEFTALRSDPSPDHQWGRLWLPADLLREHLAGVHFGAARFEATTPALIAITAAWLGRNPVTAL
ncbi:MAG: hypothetical protein HQ486_06435 [Acidimicrobiaceae bacterium]|nr:hypothetical protein [Acidimicrobiaceae bacterium]